MLWGPSKGWEIRNEKPPHFLQYYYYDTVKKIEYHIYSPRPTRDGDFPPNYNVLIKGKNIYLPYYQEERVRYEDVFDPTLHPTRGIRHLYDLDIFDLGNYGLLRVSFINFEDGAPITEYSANNKDAVIEALNTILQVINSLNESQILLMPSIRSGIYTVRDIRFNCPRTGEIISIRNPEYAKYSNNPTFTWTDDGPFIVHR